jgi:hypothetical protein
MPDSPLAVAGAEVQPTAAAPLHTNEFFTGLWTQGNPLGPGAVPFLYQKFYSAARFDRLVGGQNTEVTTRLTLGRRPGSSVYNSNAFPPINRFYEFRAFQTAGEVIHTLASCDAATGSTQGTVRDVTGPTNNVVLWKKDPAAGRTSFQNVGNLLYFADGVDEKKWVTSARSWATNSPVVGNIASIQVKAEPTRSPGVYVYVLVVNLSAPLSVLPAAGQVMTLAGLTAYTALNGTSWTFQETAGYYGQDVSNTSQLFFDAQALSTYATTADTGTITTGANPASLFAAGDWIVDTNNNIQKAMGAQVANIIGVQVQTTFIPGAIILPGRAARLVNLFFDPATPLNLDDGIQLNLAGLTTRAGLNGVTGYSVQVQSSTHITFAAVYVAAAVPVTAFVAETGTASTGTGLTGGSQPAWDASAPVTQDGGQQWSNMGSAVQNWGFPAPAVAPSVTQAAAPSIYPAWAANTWYSPSFVILDTNGNLQRLTTAGVTAGGAPAWNITVGGTTADNTAVWTNLGPSGWVGATVYAVGAAVQATYSYYITVPVIMYHWNGYTLVPTITYQQQLVTVTSLFVCAQAGTSGTNVPSWTNGTGTTVIDGTVGWKNVGAAPAWPGAAQTLSLAAKIIDSNNNIQTPLSTGISSGAAPTWKTANGATTSDTGLSWLNGGPYSAANTGAWRWAYSGKNSITGHVGTASPMSIELVTAAGQLPVVQGQGLSDIQIDTIVLWRTEQGGSTLLYNDEFGNPGAGQTWIYTDTTQDASSSSSASQGQLNPLITAPIDGVNDPPPAGFIPQCYYLNRIWGYKGNRLIWSTGPDAITGSGDESFSPGNGFQLPQRRRDVLANLDRLDGVHQQRRVGSTGQGHHKLAVLCRELPGGSGPGRAGCAVRERIHRLRDAHQRPGGKHGSRRRRARSRIPHWRPIQRAVYPRKHVLRMAPRF